MTQTVDAVFENGLLRPLAPLPLSNGQHVKLTVEMDNRAKVAHVIELAQKVYEGLSPEDCFDFHVRGELEDLGLQLEVADLFDAAEELGFNRLAGHVLAEASLDYVTEGPFDRAAGEGAGDEPF